MSGIFIRTVKIEMQIMREIISIQHAMSSVSSEVDSTQLQSAGESEPRVNQAVRCDAWNGCGKCATCTCEQVEEPAKLGDWDNE